MKIVRLTAVTSMAVVMLAGLTLSFSAKTVLAGTVVRDHRGSTTRPMPAPKTGLDDRRPGHGPGGGAGFDGLNPRHGIPGRGVTVRDHR